MSFEYYPFGLQASTSWTRENNSNNFLYNAANELNQTSGWYDMFYRNYDPALGRMLQVDPLATKFSSYSPYNYALNSPALLNDPRGAQAQAPPGVSESAWRRITTDRNDPNYMDHWYEDFAVYAANQGAGSAHVDPKDFGAVISAFLSGSFKVGDNSAEYFYVHEGASVYLDAQGDPVFGSEFGGNTVFYDIIDLTTIVSRTMGSMAQEGHNSPFDWEDADNIGDIISSIAAGPALAGGIAEYEIVNKLVRNAQKDYYSEAINSVSKYNKIIGTAGKVLGITGVVTSFGELVTEDFSWTNLTKFGINVASLAIKANPIGLSISLTIGLIDATGYLDRGLNYIYNENTSR